MASIPARHFGQEMLRELQLLGSDSTCAPQQEPIAQMNPAIQMTTPARFEQQVHDHMTQQHDEQKLLHQKQQGHTHERQHHDVQADPEFCVWQSRLDRLVHSSPAYNPNQHRGLKDRQEHCNPSGFGESPRSRVWKHKSVSGNDSNEASRNSLVVNNPHKGFSTGVLKRWNAGKGFGFIQPDQDDEDIVVHMSALSEAKGSVKEGDAVIFQTQYDERKGKCFASRLERQERSRSRGYGTTSKNLGKSFDEQGDWRRLPGLQSLPGLPDIFPGAWAQPKWSLLHVLVHGRRRARTRILFSEFGI